MTIKNRLRKLELSKGNEIIFLREIDGEYYDSTGQKTIINKKNNNNIYVIVRRSC